MIDEQYKRIRKEAFSDPYPLNQELITLATQEKNHAFLTNPPILLIYTYLVAYVKEFATTWFDHADGLRILDWGSGKGHITFLLQEAYRGSETEIISCDIADEQWAGSDSSFRQKTPIISGRDIQIVPLNHAYQLPFPDHSFDVVISMGVLEHVPQDQESLQEIYRILKPGGLFFCFFLPYQWSWTQQLAHLRGNYYHDRLYTKSQVKEMLGKVTFQLLDIWHRQLLPKNSFRYPAYQGFERADQWMCHHTPFRHLATNIEFVASKGRPTTSPS